MTRKEKLEKTIDFDDAIHRIIRLEEENVKLKEELVGFKLKVDALEGETPWKDIKDKSEVIGKLTKAKELLREYIRINLLPPIERNFDDEVKLFEQAEQFLKESEVEK